ncbi:MAG TPA: DUF885 domain-containing protein [Candidatus Dormibacteraeota bacterium]|nr:DUF885 domain-containing protein [Candidatus Dormibacteraeota bacterium]
MATIDEETHTGEELIARFFDRLMELRPVEASYHGLHQHDPRLPDGSLSGVQELIALVHGFESELGRLGDGPELDLARYWAGLTRFQLEEQRLWAKRPEAVDQIGTGVFLLFVRDYAPLEVRLEAIASRLEAVPAYLAASREQLREPVRLWVRTALDSARRLPELFDSVVRSAPEGPLRRRLTSAAAAAGEAVDDFCGWLEGEVLARSTEAEALGEERFAALLDLRQLPDPPDRILALGRRYLAEFEDERAALVARHWPGRRPEEVDELVRARHPATMEAVLTAYGEAITAARSFVEQQRLATLPPGEELLVEATPSFLRPVIPFAAYEPPARFDAHQLGIYMVTPGEDGLRGHDHASVLNTSVHEGYPGHHLQFACANQHPSLARLLSADHAVEMVEGWAHYCEELMYEQGFMSGPEVRFVQLNGLIWRACRVVIDVELSCGRMGFPEAVEMLVSRAAMPRPGAEAEVRRYTYTPGYQLSYLYGKHLLLALRERRRRLEGDRFQLRRFHDRLLYAGAVPAAMWDSLFD